MMNDAVQKQMISTRRRGISLLEVLAAMLVLTVGILSMARLIPVGVYELAVANKLDQSSTLGRASFRDIEVRGYLQPSLWFDPAMPSGYLVDPTTGLQAISYNWATGHPPFGVAGNGVPFPPAVVIDPLMITSNSGVASAVQTFPYQVNGITPIAAAPWIPRVNVMVPNATFVNFPMSYALADRIFRSSDERTYTPPDPTDPVIANRRPQMLFADASGAPTQAISAGVQSISLGNDSWFVTVFPSLAETNMSASPSLTTAPLNSSHQFTATVVICNKRDLTVPTSTVNSPTPGERMLPATLLLGSFAGGDVLLTVPVAGAGLGGWLNVKPGQWIMLSAIAPQPGSPIPRLFADWYRIVATGAINPPISSDPSIGHERYVTLQGPDWPTFTTGVNVYATIVDGVTGVFQKTITLDGTSSWQP